MEVAYVGNHGSNLIGIRDINQPRRFGMARGSYQCLHRLQATPIPQLRS